MSEGLPEVYLARHGNTPWTLSGQHTGFTDLPLTPNGERNARRLGERLKGMAFAKVFTSPLQRASRTCELAGFGAMAQIDPDLVEWDYGRYEGLTSAEILSRESRLAIVPRRRSGRRIANANRRAGGPRGAASARSRWQRACLFQRTLHPSVDRALAGAQSRSRRPILSAQPGEPERAQL